MRHLKFVAAILICVVVGLTANAVPEFLKASPEFYFTHIEPMSNSTNAMEIANIGDTPLEIHRVRACCGAKAGVSATRIEPGESATLTVSLGPMAKPGTFRKKVTLYTNDPSAPVVEIPIVGEVVAAKVKEQGGDAVVQNAAATPSGEAGGSASGAETESMAETQPAGVRLALRLSVVLLLGLVTVFVLAAKGSDSERMSRWPKRNVVPSKIFLGLVFAILAYLLWPDFTKHVAAQAPYAADAPVTERNAPAASSGVKVNPVNPVNPVRNNNPAVERMSDDELAAGNDRLDALVRNPSPSDGELLDVVSSISDEHRDPNWRNYCLQVVPELIVNVCADDPRAEVLWAALEFGLVERGTPLPGTALLGLDRLNKKGLVTDEELSDFILVIAQDAETLPGNRVTALRLGAERDLAEVLPSARRWAKCGENQFIRKAAISVLRDIGTNDDIEFLRSLLPASTREDPLAIGTAIDAIRRRAQE